MMEATTLGVRTRARTLALQRLQSSSSPSPSPSPPPSSASDSCYLQLRSRRLQKTTPLPHPHTTEVSKEHPESVKSGSVGSVSITQNDGFSQVQNRGRVTEYVNDFGAEISFGGNTLDFERSDRYNNLASFSACLLTSFALLSAFVLRVVSHFLFTILV